MGPLALLSLAQTGYGIYQTVKGAQDAKNLQRPEYEIPQSMKAALAQAQQQSQTGLPEEIRRQYDEDIQRSTQGTLRGLDDMRAGLGALSAAQQQQVEGSENLAAMDAEQRMRNISALQQMRESMARYEDQAFNINEMQAFQDASAAASAMQGAGIQNISGGLQGIVKAGELKKTEQQQDTTTDPNAQVNADPKSGGAGGDPTTVPTTVPTDESKSGGTGGLTFQPRTLDEIIKGNPLIPKTTSPFQTPKIELGEMPTIPKYGLDLSTITDNSSTENTLFSSNTGVVQGLNTTFGDLDESAQRMLTEIKPDYVVPGPEAEGTELKIDTQGGPLSTALNFPNELSQTISNLPPTQPVGTGGGEAPGVESTLGMITGTSPSVTTSAPPADVQLDASGEEMIEQEIPLRDAFEKIRDLKSSSAYKQASKEGKRQLRDAYKAEEKEAKFEKKRQRMEDEVDADFRREQDAAALEERRSEATYTDSKGRTLTREQFFNQTPKQRERYFKKLEKEEAKFEKKRQQMEDEVESERRQEREAAATEERRSDATYKDSKGRTITRDQFFNQTQEQRDKFFKKNPWLDDTKPAKERIKAYEESSDYKKSRNRSAKIKKRNRFKAWIKMGKEARAQYTSFKDYMNAEKTYMAKIPK